MNIKEKIGARITQARKALGITIKELAERTGELSAARISNWEQGTRSPGPTEAKQLAKALNISAAFLLCLTDNPNGDLAASSNTIRFIPIIEMDQTHLVQSKGKENIFNSTKTKIIVDGVMSRTLLDHAFAIVLDDNSMEPEFRKNDLVVVDQNAKPNPGDFVLAHLPQKNKNCLRQYSESHSNNSLFQLLPQNQLWPVIEVVDQNEVVILGRIIEHRRFFV